MQKTPRYFDLEELLTSSTARQKSIENLPSWEVMEHLYELALVLDEIRQGWGPIKVTSGFRNEALNKAVGGSPTSVHQIGYAADLYPGNGDFVGFVTYMKLWAQNNHFDQLLIEKSKKSRWVHIGLYNNAHQQRHQVKNMEV